MKAALKDIRKSIMAVNEPKDCWEEALTWDTEDVRMLPSPPLQRNSFAYHDGNGSDILERKSISKPDGYCFSPATPSTHHVLRPLNYQHSTPGSHYRKKDGSRTLPSALENLNLSMQSSDAHCHSDFSTLTSIASPQGGAKAWACFDDTWLDHDDFEDDDQDEENNLTECASDTELQPEIDDGVAVSSFAVHCDDENDSFDQTIRMSRRPSITHPQSRLKSRHPSSPLRFRREQVVPSIVHALRPPPVSLLPNNTQIVQKTTELKCTPDALGLSFKAAFGKDVGLLISAIAATSAVAGRLFPGDVILAVLWRRHSVTH